MSIFSRNKRKAVAGAAAGAMLLIATPFVSDFEGLRTKAYRDAVGIPTICYGETEGVKMGDTQTVESCGIMLKARLEMFGIAVDYIIEPPMSPSTHAAFTSLTYNIGIGAFQKSSVAKLYNAGKKREACDFMLKYNRAGGKVLAGLTRRREAERKLCLSGL